MMNKKEKTCENHLFDCFAFVWCEWKLLPQLKPIGPVASSISAHIRILRKIAHYVSCNLLFSKLGKQLSNYHPAIEIIKSENSYLAFLWSWFEGFPYICGSVNVVNFDAFTIAGSSQTVKIGIVNREFRVILVQNPGSRSLNWHLSNGKSFGFSIRTP